MLEIAYEDDSLMVLVKPSGQTVNRMVTTRKEVTVQDELEERFGITRSEEGVGGRAGIVHRLDKGTSGILVVAKTQRAFKDLQAQFKARRVAKEYLALVHGEAPREGRVEAPLARHPKQRFRFAVVEGGRQALTEFKREGVFERGVARGEPRGRGERYSLLRICPTTGRTHQIRVHLKHIGHPVVADPFYLSRKKLEDDLAFCPRLFLHAVSLSFVHPATGARMRLEAELSEDLREALTSLTVS